MIATECLRRFHVLSGIGDNNLHKVAMIARERRVAADTVVFRSGQRAAWLYLLSSGEVDIRVGLDNGERVVVDTILPGNLIGWSAFLSPRDYHFDGVAHRNSALIEIDAYRLRQLVDHDHEFGYRLMRGVAGEMIDRMQATRAHLAQLTV